MILMFGGSLQTGTMAHTKSNRTKISLDSFIPVFLYNRILRRIYSDGMGIFFLGLLVLVGKYDIISANIIKTLVVSVFTMIILCIFAWKGLVRWDIGLLMAVGQSLGGFDCILRQAI